MPTPEGRVKAKIAKLLKSYPKLWYFMPVPVMYQARTVDYLVCYCRRFIAIEAKKPKGKPTALQDKTLRDIEAAGGETFVVADDVGLEALKTFLDNLH
jgi:hypothetical protein